MKTRNYSKNPMTEKECLKAIQDQKPHHTPTPCRYLVSASPFQSNGKYIDRIFNSKTEALDFYSTIRKDLTLSTISFYQLDNEDPYKKILLERIGN